MALHTSTGSLETLKQHEASLVIKKERFESLTISSNFVFVQGDKSEHLIMLFCEMLCSLALFPFPLSIAKRYSPPHRIHKDWVSVCQWTTGWDKDSSFFIPLPSLACVMVLSTRGWHNAKYRCDFYDLDICLVCTRLGPQVLSQRPWKNCQMVMNFSHCWLQLDTNKWPKGTRFHISLLILSS